MFLGKKQITQEDNRRVAYYHFRFDFEPGRRSRREAKAIVEEAFTGKDEDLD
jgi:hypothetical protein